MADKPVTVSEPKRCAWGSKINIQDANKDGLVQKREVALGCGNEGKTVEGTLKEYGLDFDSFSEVPTIEAFQGYLMNLEFVINNNLDNYKEENTDYLEKSSEQAKKDAIESGKLFLPDPVNAFNRYFLSEYDKIKERFIRYDLTSFPTSPDRESHMLYLSRLGKILGKTELEMNIDLSDPILRKKIGAEEVKRYLNTAIITAKSGDIERIKLLITKCKSLSVAAGIPPNDFKEQLDDVYATASNASAIRNDPDEMRKVMEDYKNRCRAILAHPAAYAKSVQWQMCDFAYEHYSAIIKSPDGDIVLKLFYKKSGQSIIPEELDIGTLVLSLEGNSELTELNKLLLKVLEATEVTNL